MEFHELFTNLEVCCAFTFGIAVCCVSVLVMSLSSWLADILSSLLRRYIYPGKKKED